MLAYVFWHRPNARTDAARYEDSIVRFQEALVHHPPSGFIGATSFAVEPVPWLSNQRGYEDWYLIEGSWAMDPLNAFAVSGQVQDPHDNAAAQMDEGHGGIYAHVAGDGIASAQSTAYWLTRPRGIQWRPALDAVRARTPQINVWRRQMVLGAAGEFAIEIPGEREFELPPGWSARRVRRQRLPHG